MSNIVKPDAFNLKTASPALDFLAPSRDLGFLPDGQMSPEAIETVNLCLHEAKEVDCEERGQVIPFPKITG